MSGLNTLDSRPTTLEHRLELSFSEVKQRLADLICKEQVNQLWKLGVESTLHAIWAQVCSPRVSVSVNCQTGEQCDQDGTISCESYNPQQESGQTAFEEESCFKPLRIINAEEQSESHNTEQDEEERQFASRGGQANIVVVTVSSSCSNEKQSSTSVVPDASQVRLTQYTNRSRTEKKKLYSCTLCGRKFTRKDNLAVHEQRHLNPTAFKCQRCSRVLCNRRGLLRHDIACQKRSRKLPFECVTCGKSYDTKEQLKNHSYHHKEKKHLCPVCGMAFRSPANLKTHMVTHSGERSFRCRSCMEQFTTCGNLNRHVSTCHSK